MLNLMRTTAKACADGNGVRMFWFTWLERVVPETVLSALIWYVPGESEPAPRISPRRAQMRWAVRGTV